MVTHLRDAGSRIFHEDQLYSEAIYVERYVLTQVRNGKFFQLLFLGRLCGPEEDKYSIMR